MSVNRFQPHLLVLPEDDANRQLVEGFLLDPYFRGRFVRVLPEAGGWTKVLDGFVSDHLAGMDRFRDRLMVLLMDFDGQEERLQNARSRIPERLADRVFVLGCWTQPEDLRSNLGSYEVIGKKLAQDCREGRNVTWGHELLNHNAHEVDRLRLRLGPLLSAAD